MSLDVFQKTALRGCRNHYAVTADWFTGRYAQ